MISLVAATAALLLQGDAPSAPPPPLPPAKAIPQGEPAKPPPSQALEELLRRLSAERGAPSVVSPNPLAPPAPESGRKAAESTERAVLTRASDPVEVILANGIRRDLEFWDARLELSAGDEIRQGSHACATIEFPDGAHFRVDGEAIWRMVSDAHASPRRVDFLRLGRSLEFHLGHAALDTVITLPGGNQLAGHDSHLMVRDRDLRAFEIRNLGPEPLVIRCPYLGGRVLTLQAGQIVFLPALPEPAAFVANLTHAASVFDDARGRLVVQAPEEIALSPSGDAIELAGRGTFAGIARACGARMVLTPGATLRLTRAPLGFPRKREWEE